MSCKTSLTSSWERRILLCICRRERVRIRRSSPRDSEWCSPGGYAAGSASWRQVRTAFQRLACSEIDHTVAEGRTTSTHTWCLQHARNSVKEVKHWDVKPSKCAWKLLCFQWKMYTITSSNRCQVVVGFDQLFEYRPVWRHRCWRVLRAWPEKSNIARLL